MEKIKLAFFKFINWQYCGLFLIVLFSLVMHLSVITQPSDGYIFDETYYIKDAQNIIDLHTTDRPEHPPLSKLIIVGGIELFGDNPIGWRLPPILFGIANLILLFLICRQLKLSVMVSTGDFPAGAGESQLPDIQLDMLDVSACSSCCWLSGYT
jgi:predicted membrane-bound dolichyl-phosphate-mannose-protein mannosyltransferase